VIALVVQTQKPARSPQQDGVVRTSSTTQKTSSIDSSLLLPDEKSDQVIASTTPKRDPNAISAESYLVADLQTGKIYIDHDTDKVFPIASLSKLFTALVAVHILDQSKPITITQQMIDTYGDSGHLVKDEKFTVQELLYPLLLESSNDTAEAYAQSFGYKSFIDYMNSFAREIGMNNTSFKDASGLSASNISTSKDLFVLAQYLYKHESAILDVTRQKEYSLATTTDHGSHHFLSINPFVFYKPFIGGKTGRTEQARESIVSMFAVEKNSKTYPVVVILLRSDFGEREADTEKVLDQFMKSI
jgi:D-alanyl-D-alanine carboxypeptidase